MHNSSPSLSRCYLAILHDALLPPPPSTFDDVYISPVFKSAYIVAAEHPRFYSNFSRIDRHFGAREREKA